jgi:hypothetical protein
MLLAETLRHYCGRSRETPLSHARAGVGHKFEKPGDDPAFRVALYSSFS